MPKKIDETYFEGYLAALEDISEIINRRVVLAEKDARRVAGKGDYMEAARISAACETYDRFYNTVADVSGCVDPLDTRKEFKKKLQEFYEEY